MPPFFLYFRWTVVSPDPQVSQFSLLVREDSRLALLQGTLSKRLEDIMKPKLQHVPEQSISSTALRMLNLVQSHSISPMNFPACPKGSGCPKITKRQGAPIRTDQPEKTKIYYSTGRREAILICTRLPKAIFNYPTSQKGRKAKGKQKQRTN